MSTLGQRTLAPPVTPRVPPQLVACGARDFHRITQSSLQVFEIAAELPPPHIRGSRVARQTNDVAIDQPSNVLVSLKMSVLVIAKQAVLRYEVEGGRTEHYAPIQASVPLFAWPDPRRANSLRVRTAADEKVRDYSLVDVPSGDAASQPAPAQAARREEELPGFDARLFTVLGDGTPFYSTSKGLVRRGHEARPSAFPQLSTPAAIFFGDSSPVRYWTADAAGRLSLWDEKQGGPPILALDAPGVVIDSALEGERVAVLSLALDSERESYRPTVTIFTSGKEQARLKIGPTVGSHRQPELDLCLIAGRPWVLVGGAHWLQLLDWESRRLLAEW